MTQAEVAGIGRILNYEEETGRLTRQIAYGGGVVNITAPDLLTFQFIDYQWDALGNLTSRHNQSALVNAAEQRNEQEAYCYDNLNRLIHTAVGESTCNTPSTPNQTYDGFGNITRSKGRNKVGQAKIKCSY